MSCDQPGDKRCLVVIIRSGDLKIDCRIASSDVVKVGIVSVTYFAARQMRALYNHDTENSGQPSQILLLLDVALAVEHAEALSFVY